MKNFKLNWQSLVVGLVLCAVLGVFVGSKIAEPQIATRANAQRVATVNELYEQNVSLVAKIAATDEHLVRIEKKIDERCDRIEKKIDDMNKDLARVLRAL